MKTKTKKIAQVSITHVILISASILFIVPFIWMVSTSLKPIDQIFKSPPQWVPNPFRWANYSEAVEYIPFFTYLKNTIVITSLSTLGAIISCPLIAYSFAKLQWRGRNVLFVITLAVMMIPGEVTMIPMFLIFNDLGWVGTPLPLIIPHFFGGPFYIFLLRQFFKGLPDNLRDAALIDGANEWQIYFRIMLPLARPAVLTIGLFQFMASWTDFMGPLIYLTDESQYTLSIGLQQFQSQFGTEWGMLMAVSTLMTLPIIVLFFFLQKAFIQGINFSGTKG